MSLTGLLRAGVLIFFLAFSPPALTACAQNTDAPRKLERVEDRLARKHDTITHEEIEDARSRLGDQNVILLDVREAEEFAVSHIPGARRVDPDASGAEVLAMLGAVPEGSEIVLYCAVGTRSSRLGEKVREELATRDDVTVTNLRGGVFGWHNRGLPLVDAEGETPLVHPYSWWRKSLLVNPDQSASAPQ